jgi:1-acyl-sn-glycerol-3-phosphate acyltransferase
MCFKRFHFRNSWVKRVFQSVAFFSAYLVFGGVGLASSLACLGLSVFLHGQQARFFGQKLICRLFAFFIGYIRLFKLADVDTLVMSEQRDARGVIFIANHPSLLDVVLIISQMPRITCLMKSSLLRNAVLCGQARLAGYVDCKPGGRLIKSCRDALSHGGNLLIFPEGTRSKETLPGPFKMGFAMIAKASHCPVQTIIIKNSGNFLGKGSAFFRQPALPFHCSVRLGKRFEIKEDEDARSFGRGIESYYQAVLREPDNAPCQI